MAKAFAIEPDGAETEVHVFDSRFTPPGGQRVRGWVSPDGEWMYDDHNDVFHRLYDPNRKLEDYYKV